ncbi:MAG: Gfo/Idh/MocA family protein [Anaerolineae bacterium]
MDEIRIALVGLGTRGTGAWLNMLQSLAGYRVTAICDPMQALHARAISRLKDAGGARVYEHYEDVLADDNVDAIALTVRCREQGALAAMALEAGKHVNCEVPASHSIEDCWRIVLAQERSGKVYQLAEQVRYAGFVQAWRRLVAEGQLGHITLCEGQYFHYYVEKNYQDPGSGRFFLPEESAAHPEAKPTFLNSMPPIHYLPHELSPMLRVLGDRITEVVGMSTRSPSYAHPRVAQPDMQMALMKTEKDAILRLGVSFAQPHPHANYHWYHVMGTKGAVEWKRADRDLPRLWLADAEMHDVSEVDWRWERLDAPAEARGSGHNDMDYYVHASFRDAVLRGEPLEFDVYKAMDTAAPAIMAAESMAQGGKPLPVPDFRPSAKRAHGSAPTQSG